MVLGRSDTLDRAVQFAGRGESKSQKRTAVETRFVRDEGGEKGSELGV